VEERKVTLRDVRAESAAALVRRALEGYLERLRMDALLKKVDFIYARCRPDAGFAGMGGGYKFDRARLARLDRMRHDSVHEVGIEAAEGYTDDDDQYLAMTALHLQTMVAKKFDLKIDPNFLQQKWIDAARPRAH